MKLRIASDLHLEFRTFKSHVNPGNPRDYNSFSILEKMENEKEQVLVLAGDIGISYRYKTLEPFFEQVSRRFREVIIIPGNHEFYHSDYDEAIQNLTSFFQRYGNITFLYNEVVSIDDVNFFGTTLWTNFFNENPTVMEISRMAMNDFRGIFNKQNLFTPQDALMRHKQAFLELQDFLEEEKDGKDVIITHHAPTSKSIADRYKNDQLTGAFVNLYDDFVKDSNTKLWIHGHCHNNFDYDMNGTRVVCNPLGYPGENKTYKKDMVVEV